MPSIRNIKIKNYIETLFAKEDEVLIRAKANAKAEGLPDIHVPPNVGKLLYCLTKIQAPKKVLEIGTLAAYSTIWIARALEEGCRIISLEINEPFAKVAKENLKLAGFELTVQVIVGHARDLLTQLHDRGEGPFDMIFLDADKGNYFEYIDKLLALSRPGTLILSDNLIPKGDTICDLGFHDEEMKGVYQFNKTIASHPQLESILTTTLVRDDGRIDALGISIVKTPISFSK